MNFRTVMPFVKQRLLRSWKECRLFEQYIKEPSREKLLPEPLKEPYYQPPITLVVELSGVLVHPEWTTAHPIIESLDPTGLAMYRLYRDATKYVKGEHVKDLSCLNRDLSKVILIDWNPKASQLQPENTLLVPKWDGNNHDTDLVDLAALLTAIAAGDVADVRPILEYYSTMDNPVEEFRKKRRILMAWHTSVISHNPYLVNYSRKKRCVPNLERMLVWRQNTQGNSSAWGQDISIDGREELDRSVCKRLNTSEAINQSLSMISEILF
ncbi:NIF domain containing protein [Trichuris trichiura]|uniref:Mitochondrial import inner membrane translocase subunit TIM50 n=1 Tax=Trichuris trichiura TaxID=36087 RepID=A0A077Z3N2_TRITR|nr:NIF domain containing protein [Trichuris trichiura]